MSFPQSLARLAFRLLLPALLCAAPLSAALAQQMVSVAGKVVNMRDAAGMRSTVLWELDRGYPLKVVQRRGDWLKVRDFENDEGWVARSLIGTTPHHVVKVPSANIRKGPGTQHRIVGKAIYGEVLRTQSKRAGWVSVQRADGVRGWVSRGLLWGW